MNWMQEEEALRTEAAEIRRDVKTRFPRGWNCWGGIKRLRRAADLDTKAFRLVANRKLGPPRPHTARFDQFLA